MNVKIMLQMTAIGIAIAGAPFVAWSVDNMPAARAAERAMSPSSASPTMESKKNRSKRAAPKPKQVVVVESLTLKEATARAADPKALSGALIMPEDRVRTARPPSSKASPPSLQDERAQ